MVQKLHKSLKTTDPLFILQNKLSQAINQHPDVSLDRTLQDNMETLSFWFGPDGEVADVLFESIKLHPTHDALPIIISELTPMPPSYSFDGELCYNYLALFYNLLLEYKPVTHLGHMAADILFISDDDLQTAWRLTVTYAA